MLEMQLDIPASEPHHTASFINQSSSGLLDGSRFYFVLWPLLLVGSMDLTIELIRVRAIARDCKDSTSYRDCRHDCRPQLPSVWNTKPDLRLGIRREEVESFPITEVEEDDAADEDNKRSGEAHLSRFTGFESHLYRQPEPVW
ncbi:hypothetical protein LZ554_001733 [Drepanopeziza brunnea f. sp. 'monogermtubi']|nr:hypothetical protein LZ554_001733 [Drepanopeziza brunnea f. sp. 'monogermtubi']